MKQNKIDLSLPIDLHSIATSWPQYYSSKALTGHVGTHLDLMGKTFPLNLTELPGIVFDIRKFRNNEISVSDIDLEKVKPRMMVCFCGDVMSHTPYGSDEYPTEHPILSNELIDALIEKGTTLIGLDFAGARNGKEHYLTDLKCADNGIFIIENMTNFGRVLNGHTNADFKAKVYPMNYINMTGLPCRIIAEIYTNDD